MKETHRRIVLVLLLNDQSSEMRGVELDGIWPLNRDAQPQWLRYNELDVGREGWCLHWMEDGCDIPFDEIVRSADALAHHANHSPNSSSTLIELDCPNWYSAQSRGFSTNYGAFRIGKPTASHPAPHYGMEGNDDWKQAWEALYPGVQIMSGCAGLSAMMRIWEKITATSVTQWEGSLAAGHDGWADLIGENPGLTEHPQLAAWKSDEEKNRTQSGKKRSASKRGRPRGSGNPYSTIIAAAIGIHENARAAGQRMTQCQAA